MDAPCEQRDDRAVVAWDTRFAKSLFNASWDLIAKSNRTDDEAVEMLLCAMGSRVHWGRVGRPEQIATGDWQVAHVAALLGLGDLALMFAKRSLATAVDKHWDGWRLASAQEGMARACAVLGDADGVARHVAEAEAALEREPDDEDRALVTSQLATIPAAAERTQAANCRIPPEVSLRRQLFRKWRGWSKGGPPE